MGADNIAAKFDGHWRKIVAVHRTKLNALPIPSLIYHYTDEAGLRGILSSGALWVNDVESVNDPSEFSHAVKLGLAFLKPLLPQRVRDTTFGALLEEKYENVRGRADHFLCSFSRTTNDIGQWRAYAEDGQGFALAFDRVELENAFIKGQVTPAERVTFRIQYGRNTLNRHLVELIEPYQDILPTLQSDELLDVVHGFMQAFLNLSVAFKHSAYRGESEYRFLELSPKNSLPTKRRDGFSTKVGYREFNWQVEAPTALRKIIAGPVADSMLAKRLVTEWAIRSKVNSVRVVTSKIPYRRTRGTPNK